MGTQKIIDSNKEEEIIEQINRIVLLKIKTLIIKNIKQKDVSEFEQAVKKNDISILLAFAQRKVPHLSTKIHEEMKLLGQKITEKTYE